MKSNYIDKKGNYINTENLSLTEIFNRGREEGYKKGYVDGMIKAAQISNDVFENLVKGGTENE